MGQFLRGLFNGQRPPPEPRSPSNPTPTTQDESTQQQQRPQPDGSDDTANNSNPYAKQQPVDASKSRKIVSLKSAPPKTASPRASLGATTAKKNFKTIDTSSATYEATQGFDAVAIKCGGGFETLQPVDAISESKSTSSGTRRVYKVIRVAPSNFLTAKKHQSNLGSTKSAVGQQQATTQPHQQQSQQNNKQTGIK